MVGHSEQQLAERVGQVLAAFRIETSDEALRRLHLWLSTVDRWRHKVNLTGARSADQLVDLMLADACVLAGELSAGTSVVDVGSGAGAPGLPLGLLRPDLRLCLVEPRQKRAALLRTTLGAVGATGIEVVQGRAEHLVERSFDVALSRATLPPAEWLELGSRLAPRGQIWALLAEPRPPELGGWSLAVERAYRWPLTGAKRWAAGYRPLTQND